MSILSFLFGKLKNVNDNKPSTVEEDEFIECPEIGSEYRSVPKNPFDSILNVKIIDIRGEYVQYIFLPDTPTSRRYPASNTISTFNSIYKLVKR
jgi:hypothetical protein